MAEEIGPEPDGFTTHIKHTSVKPELKDKSWCGKGVRYVFAFGSADHAAYNAMNGGRLVPCGKCVAALMKALQSQLSADTKG